MSIIRTSTQYIRLWIYKAYTRIAGNIDFVIPFFFLVSIRLLYLSPSSSFLPGHDTMVSGESFYWFYREYFLYGDIPLWAPYIHYGTTLDYLLIYGLTPALYFVAFLGKMLLIKNALVLFIWGVFLEELIFLIGVYLLCCHLFQHRLTTILVCLTAVGTVFWPIQLYWNFRIYYLLPFVLLFMIKFMDTYRFEFLWTALIVCLISLIGNITYLAPFYALILLVFTFVLGITTGLFANFRLKNLFSPLSIATAAILVLLCCAFFDLTNHAFDYEVIWTRESGWRVPLSQWLSHVVSAYDQLSGLFTFLYPAQIHQDRTMYVPPVMLIFCAYGLMKRPTPRLAAMSVTALVTFLLGLSLLTSFPVMVYYLFPYLSMVRHLSHFAPVAKLFVILMAGYGVEAAFTSDRKISLFSFGLILLVVIIVVDRILCSGKLPFNICFKTNEFVTLIYQLHYLGILAAILILWFLRPNVVQWNLNIKNGIVIAILAFNLSCYQWMLFTQSPIHIPEKGIENLPKKVTIWIDEKAGAGTFYKAEFKRDAIRRIKSTFDVRQYKFQQMRIPAEEAWKNSIIYNPAIILYFGVKYNHIFFSSLYDICFPFYKTDYISLGVDRLIRSRLGMKLDQPSYGEPYKFADLEKDKIFCDAIGCLSSKLYLTKDLQYAKDLEAAANLIKGSSSLRERPVVVAEPQPLTLTGTAIEANNTAINQRDLGSLKILQFNANSLEIDSYVKVPEGAWLVYADAFHPQWRASINGQPQEILPANLAFKAVKLYPGQNNVRFWFEGNAGGRTSIVSREYLPKVHTNYSPSPGGRGLGGGGE